MANTNDNATLLLSELDQLVSEGRNPNTMDLDSLSTQELVTRLNEQDHLVAPAITLVLEPIGHAVDAIVSCLRRGGRLIYIGAGTSGRLGILDAVECRPTFSVSDDLVQGIIAGGEDAIQHAVEGAEDDSEAAITDLHNIKFTDKDILVGIAASGRTPYVLSALKHANTLGAQTVGVSCNPNAAITAIANISICAAVGPEALTGSTRLKSGTAQKLILNMLSTASMIKLGKVYENLMVDVNASNRKLKARAIRIVMQATRCTQQVAEQALADANQQAKLAILMVLTGLDAETANQLLIANQGHLRASLEG